MHEDEDISKSRWQEDQEVKIEDEDQSMVKQSNHGLKIKGSDLGRVKYCKRGLTIENFQELGIIKKGMSIWEAQSNVQYAWWCSVDEQMVQWA